MAETHVTVTLNPSGNQTQVHNPGQAPLHPGAGQPVVAVAKPAGQPNGTVHGQVSGSSVIVHNPA